MFEIKDILETKRMISENNLDVRTITMGISLRDCAHPDINVTAQKIYDKIDPIKHFYYLKLMGVFANFIERVSLGYPLSPELIQYANGLTIKEVKLQAPKVIGNISLSEKDMNKKRFN